METYNQKILSALTQFLLDNPEIGFGDALHEIGINQYVNQTNPAQCDFTFRNICNDNNEQIYKRILIKTQTK